MADSDTNTSSIWGKIGKYGAGTIILTIAGSVGTWTWNTLDKHDKELVRMREEIKYLQQKAEKVDAHEADIAVLKAINELKRK